MAAATNNPATTQPASNNPVTQQADLQGGAAAAPKTPGKARIATTWLDGCSGCHMSFLDMDERLIALAPLVDLVYSPLVDFKEYPENVDVCLIEGAIATVEDVEKARLIRSRTKILVSLGDCAVMANVPSMRNPFKLEAVSDRAYRENTALGAGPIPSQGLPALLRRVIPVHEVVKVDLHIPGCPPPADVIHFAVAELLAGRVPDLAALTRFGR